VVTKLLDHLAPGGYLFLGFAETARHQRSARERRAQRVRPRRTQRT